MNPMTNLVLPAVTARFVLFANHVLGAVPAATDRLRTHAGRSLRIEIEGWRLPVPPPPALLLRITPAGLLEADDVTAEPAQPHLLMRLDMTQPWDAARRLTNGQMPAVHVQGDAGLAADVTWVLNNVRWDIADDLERAFGPGLAGALTRGGAKVGGTIRSMVRSVAATVFGTPHQP